MAVGTYSPLLLLYQRKVQKKTGRRKHWGSLLLKAGLLQTPLVGSDHYLPFILSVSKGVKLLLTIFLFEKTSSSFTSMQRGIWWRKIAFTYYSSFLFENISTLMTYWHFHYDSSCCKSRNSYKHWLLPSSSNLKKSLLTKELGDTDWMSLTQKAWRQKCFSFWSLGIWEYLYGRLLLASLSQESIWDFRFLG